MTESFTASNGITVFLRDGGTVQFQHGTRAESCGILQVIPHSDWWQTLREFFQHERDKELGRWRDRRYPDHVVYPSPRTPQVAGRGVQVLDERSGRLYDRWEAPTTFNEWDTSPRELAARAYFEAHLERKPWGDAKPGEAWLLTTRDEVNVFAITSSGSSGHVVFTAATHDAGGTEEIAPHSKYITSARRIRTEDAS